MNKLKEEKVYVYLALFFGILFIFLTPPFQSPDEDSHFKKSYSISKGNVFPSVKNKSSGNYFPKEMLIYINNKLKYIGNRDKKYSFSSLINDNYSKMNYNDKKFVGYSTKDVIPITYVAPSTGILFSKIAAKVFDLEMVSTPYMLYFARIFSLIACIIFTYFAIKITPVFKKLFTVVALIPMSLYLSSMVTYDSILISLSLLGIAIMLKLIYDDKVKRVTTKDIIILSFIGIILFNVKIIYSFIFLLMFRIPVKKFKDKKGMIKSAFLMIGIILIVTIIFKIPNIINHDTSNNVSYASRQISFILSHPINFVSIIFNNIINQRSFQLSSMIGIFGLIDSYLLVPFVFIELIYLFVIAFSEGSINKIKIKRIDKILMFVFSLIIIFAIYSVMYISWTPCINGGKIGKSDISGVQGRYFLPLLVPMLLLFSNKTKKLKKFFESISNNYLLIPVLMLSISVVTLLLRFWA